MPEVRNLVTALLLCVALAALGVAAVAINRVQSFEDRSLDESGPLSALDRRVTELERALETISARVQQSPLDGVTRPEPEEAVARRMNRELGISNGPWRCSPPRFPVH